jgi:hypothetical protein
MTRKKIKIKTINLDNQSPSTKAILSTPVGQPVHFPNPPHVELLEIIAHNLNTMAALHERAAAAAACGSTINSSIYKPNLGEENDCKVWNKDNSRTERAIAAWDATTPKPPKATILYVNKVANGYTLTAEYKTFVALTIGDLAALMTQAFED